MGKFTVIPQDTFSALQLDAGVILKRFDPANPVAPDDADIVTATTGGVQVNSVPTFSDLGEDVDNVPANMKEFKHLDSWDMSMTTTGLGTSPRLIKLSLGCADIDSDNPSKIIPRADLLQTDFSDLWWVGDRADGGCVAVQLKNALSTAGFALQTTKAGKGQTGLTLTGHVSINAQKEMPMVFYSIDPEATTCGVTQTLANVTSSFTGTSVAIGASLTAELTAAENYTLGAVTVIMGGVDITSTAYDAGTVTIAEVTGDVVITATATRDIFTVTQTLSNVTSTYTDETVNSGASFSATLTADDTYTISSVEVTMGGDDITSTAYTSDTGVVSISSVTGAIIITATATQ